MPTFAPLDLDHHKAAAIAIYEEAFPEEERRPTERWIETLASGLHRWSEQAEGKDAATYPYDTRPFMLEEDGRLLGFFILWPMHDFVYGEHFAIDGTRRGGGLGSLILRHVLRYCGTLPFVIEVEPPQSSDIAMRRCHFYERHGMHLLSGTYMQPPYREGDDSLPLCLMASDEAYGEAHFNDITQKIHRVVYGKTNTTEKQ